LPDTPRISGISDFLDFIMIDALYIRYAFGSGPGKERQVGALLELNCQAWAHYDLRTLGVSLPEWVRSKEIYEDEVLFFRSVDSPGITKRGDVFLFGRENAADPRYFHIAIHSGFYTWESGEPILTHATKVDGTVSPWPISKFFREPRYAKLFAVKRPIALDR
jgi:hypothetical protein